MIGGLSLITLFTLVRIWNPIIIVGIALLIGGVILTGFFSDYSKD